MYNIKILCTIKNLHFQTLGIETTKSQNELKLTNYAFSLYKRRVGKSGHRTRKKFLIPCSFTPISASNNLGSASLNFGPPSPTLGSASLMSGPVYHNLGPAYLNSDPPPLDLGPVCLNSGPPPVDLGQAFLSTTLNPGPASPSAASVSSPDSVS